VKLIVGFGAGGPTDVIARIVAQDLTTQTGQAFLVENRPGANAIIATEFVARSAPDGYTMLFSSLSLLVNAILPGSKVAYDPAINEEGLRARSLKLAALQKTLKAPPVFGEEGGEGGDMLLIGWGSTMGATMRCGSRSVMRRPCLHRHDRCRSVRAMPAASPGTDRSWRS